MATERRSLQELIRERQRSSFVGRQGQVIQYRENLGLPVDDERRRFLFNIHGNAGVGKTFLTRQLQGIAAEAGILTAYLDETVEDVASAMTAVAADFSRGGVKLVEFEKRAAEYWQRRRELEADPQAPDGVAAFLTKTAVVIGLAAARDVPLAGSLFAPVDVAAAADQVNRAREYVARKIADHGVMRLLVSPAQELTPVFVSGLSRVAANRGVALFFDTYERSGLVLDQWLYDLYAGRYGDLPETLVTTISGQKPLSPNRWGEYLPVIADIPLEPFSEAEARQFLASKNFTNEAAVRAILTLSGRLPLWLATLAEARPEGIAEIGDPTGNAVERFLKWETDPGRRETAISAALPRALNQDVLAVIVPDGKAGKMFGWLRELPFVLPRGDFWAYHDVVRSAMLRFRRAQAPAEWRAQHNALARTYARWAAEAVSGTERAEGDTWSNPDWIDCTREETYHLLCADPGGNLPKALASAVRAAMQSVGRARQWAAIFADAGRDTQNAQLGTWGQRLADASRDEKLGLYFTCLINDARLDKESLALAIERRGDGYRVAGQLDQALADFDRAIELNPEYWGALASRGDTYRMRERYDDALTDLDRAIQLDPEKAWSASTRGQTYLDMGQYDDALADFSRAIELSPRDAWYIGSRGDTYRMMKRYDDALTDLNYAIEIDPEQDQALASRGWTYQEMERYAEAVADFSRVIELSPENASAYSSRGNIYGLMERYDDALTDLNRAIELSPEDAMVIATRGEIYQSAGRLEDAVADFSRAIELHHPDLAWVLASRGWAYWALGSQEEAAADLSHAIEVRLDYAWLVCRGNVYRDMERYDDALADFSRAIELDPENPWAFGARGLTCRSKERYDEALGDYSHAIELDSPEDGLTTTSITGAKGMALWVRLICASRFTDRGEVYRRMKRYDDALADYNQAIAIHPEGDDAFSGRGDVYKDMGRYEEALADFSRAIELDPSDEGLVAKRAEILQLMARGAKQQ